MVIFLLLILDAHPFFFLSCLVDEDTPSGPRREASVSDSSGLGESPWLLPRGLVGRGEKTPWLQGPSWAGSRKSSAASSSAVVSVGRCRLGPAAARRWLEASSLVSGEAGSEPPSMEP